MAVITLTPKPRQVVRHKGQFLLVESSTFRSSFSEPADSMDLTILDRQADLIPKVAKNDLVEVWQGYVEQEQPLDRLDVNTLEKVFRGRVVAAPKLSLSAASRKVTLKCLDFFDSLVRGQPITETFKNVLSSDVAAEVAKRAGLGQTITKTATRHEQLPIANKLPADIVADLAKREGYEFLVDVDGKLVFRPIKAQSERFVLTWGKDIVSVDIEELAAQVYTHVVVTGYNPATKTEVTGEAKASEKLIQDHGLVSLKVVDHSAKTAQDCRTRAKAVLDSFLRRNFQANITTVGIPHLRKGDGIRLANVAPYDGVYFLDEIERTFSGGGYLNRITASTGLEVAGRA